MALLITREKVLGRTVILSTVVAAATGTTNGNWLAVLGLGPFTVHIKGITDATVRLHGSNDPTQPTDATAEIQIGVDITADALVTIDAPLRWFKASVPTWVSGTINVYLMAQK